MTTHKRSVLKKNGSALMWRSGPLYGRIANALAGKSSAIKWVDPIHKG